MTTGAGNKVSAADYNSVRTNFLGILGTGSGNAGYGQTPFSTARTGNLSTDKVRDADWDNLRLDIQRIAAHQGTSIISLTDVARGSKVTSAPLVQYQTVYTTLYNNRLNIAVGQYSDEAMTSSSRSAGWNATISHYFNINFGSYNNARYFFNAGGNIRIRPTYTKDVSTTLNNDWEQLISGVPWLVMNYQQTASNAVGGTLISSTGFYNMPTTNTQIYTRTGGLISGAATYAVNDYTVRVRGNAAQPSIIYFECEFKDDKTYPDALFPAGDENVTGTVTNSVRMFRPSGSNVNITAPTTTTTTNL